MIDKATVEKIKSAADIVEVVSDYVHLTRRGSNFMGLCPFHNERTPSFSVNKRKNFCYCFSCHKGGSPVNFIMEKEGISYHDALLHLAKKYGIKVEERELSDEERRAQSHREALLVANEWAMELFEKNLRDTEEGRDIGLQYFYQRGVTDEAIKKFRLGYALDKPTALIDEAKRAGYDIDILRELGLVGKSQQGRLYDRFRGRVIYPILNSAGKVIAFGGRDLKGGPAKYINSPESVLYKKSNELYGIFQAKNEVSRTGSCFLVEGYMDVIGMWQSGMTNVLASSGTALTDSQIALIHRFADKVVLIYDGDAAGIKASLRGIDMLLAQKLQLKILLLPDGDDPDSFARKHTPEEFRNFVDKNAVDVIRFKTQVLISEAADDPVRRSEAIHSIVQSIASIPDKIQRITYIQECSRLLNVSDAVIASETEKARLKILETWRIRRERDKLENQYPAAQSPAVSSGTSSVAQSAHSGLKTDSQLTVTLQQAQGEHISSSQPPALHTPSASLSPFEREIIRYVLKYGMITISQETDADGKAIPFSTVDFIAEELEYDDVKFTTPHYADLFAAVRAMQDDYIRDIDGYTAEAERIVAEKRAEGHSQIATRNLTSIQIEVEEQHLEQRLATLYDTLMREYAIDYPGRILASHENDDIRRIATTLLSEKVMLSRRFAQPKEGESEFDRLPDLVPRALAEWKDEILRLRLTDIGEKMRQASAKGDTDALTALQRDAFEIMKLRKIAAKTIGERILSTK